MYSQSVRGLNTSEMSQHDFNLFIRFCLEECMSAGGVVDMTRAVGHNVEVRRVIGDLTLEK